MHALIIADTDDEDIGCDVLCDLKNVSHMLDRVEEYTNLELNKMICKGESATAFAFLHLTSLDIGPDDVVFFYIASRGYLIDTSLLQQILPYAEFTHEPDVGANLHSVATVLKEKNPRLLIGIADICSSIVSMDEAPEYVVSLTQKGEEDDVDHEKIAANYRRLFEESTGSVLVCSASPGQCAAGDDDVGGFFTYCFLEAIDIVVQIYEMPTWKTIRGTTLYLMHLNDFLEDQVPYFEVNVSSLTPAK